MYCTQCGAALAADVAFCPQCGRRVARSPLSVAADTTTATAPGPLATLPARWFAQLVDGFIVLASAFVFAIVVAMLEGADGSEGWIGGVVFVLWIVCAWLYFALFVAFGGGATPGKRLFRMRVVRAQGGAVSFARATGRFVARGIPFGVFTAFFNERRQCLHDMVADTVVIDTRDHGESAR